MSAFEAAPLSQKEDNRNMTAIIVFSNNKNHLNKIRKTNATILNPKGSISNKGDEEKKINENQTVVSTAQSNFETLGMEKTEEIFRVICMQCRDGASVLKTVLKTAEVCSFDQ